MIRKGELGGGSNGKIYPVYLQSDRSKTMVVKEVSCLFLSGLQEHAGYNQTWLDGVNFKFKKGTHHKPHVNPVTV